MVKLFDSEKLVFFIEIEKVCKREELLLLIWGDEFNWFDVSNFIFKSLSDYEGESSDESICDDCWKLLDLFFSVFFIDSICKELMKLFNVMVV